MTRPFGRGGPPSVSPDENSEDWRRMSELMGLAGHSEEARAASRRADLLASQEGPAFGGEAPTPGRQR